MQANAFANDVPEAEAADSIAQQQLRLGLKLYSDGKVADAIAAFQHGLAEAEKVGTESIETRSELHAKLGNAAASCGDFQLASVNYQAALKIAPHLTNCWCSFGDLHLRCGQHQTAIQFYLQALKLNPRHWAARANLVQALMAAKQYLVARRYSPS
jgi:tetratricopeptide (TPR) repeat protein